MIYTKKILFVDDEPLCLESLRILLTEKGYTVSVAINGKEGLEKVREENPDVIILDIKMPVMDGITMLDLLRKEPAYKKTKVIIHTNVEPDDTIIEQVITHQPLYYFIKSDICCSDLFERIKESLDTSHT